MLDNIQKEFSELFAQRQEAWQFVLLYMQYVHVIDDCVDEDKSVDKIRELTKLAALVFNSPYWRRCGTLFYVLERLTHNVYFDSVDWENSGEEWKRRDAKVMNQRGYDMLLAVVLIEFGEEKLQEISLRYREYSHKAQGHHELDK